MLWPFSFQFFFFSDLPTVYFLMVITVDQINAQYVEQKKTEAEKKNEDGNDGVEVE